MKFTYKSIMIDFFITICKLYFSPIYKISLIFHLFKVLMFRYLNSPSFSTIIFCLPWSLSTLSLQSISNASEQSVPAQPSMQTHLYSPSSSVHWPCREQPFSHPAANRIYYNIVNKNIILLFRDQRFIKTFFLI